MKLNNIRILVDNFDEMFVFYRDVLEFTPTWGDLGDNYAQFQTGHGSQLSIFSKNIMSNVTGTTQLPLHASAQDNIALIFEVENLNDIYESLTSKGIEFIDQPSDQPDWGIRVVHLRDPEGHLLELMSELPKEKFSQSLSNDFEKYS